VAARLVSNASTGVPGQLTVVTPTLEASMLEYLLAAFGSIRSDEEGQTAVEYALVLLLIALVLVTVLATGLGGVLRDTIT
jgi:Flp pilus assembly pilin Flp